MRIFLISDEISPFSNRSGLGMRVSSLAAELVRGDNDVHAVVPIKTQTDSNDYSLARRLRPIEVPAGDRTVSWHRFDGRLPSGVEIHLLHTEDKLDEELHAEAFARAALTTIGSVSTEEACCISFDRECALLPGLDSNRESNIHVLVVSKDDIPQKGVKDADAVVILGKTVARAIERVDNTEIEEMQSTGRLVTLPLWGEPQDSISLSGKSSAKTSFQASSGLPIRMDVPLFFFPTTASDSAVVTKTMERFLQGDVQAAISPGDLDVAVHDLAARYLDRLAIIPSETSGLAAMAGSDFCVSLTDPSTTATAMSCGTVPVTTPKASECAVDLEPSLESGSGIIAIDDSVDAILEALGRSIAAFDRGGDFVNLSARIRRYAGTLAQQAQAITLLVDELRS